MKFWDMMKKKPIELGEDINKSDFEKSGCTEETTLSCDNCYDEIDCCDMCGEWFDRGGEIYCCEDENEYMHICGTCHEGLEEK